MLINMPAVAVPSDAVSSDVVLDAVVFEAGGCAARPLTAFGPGTVVRERTWIHGDEYPAGIASGVGKTAGGYVRGLGDQSGAAGSGQFGASAVSGGTIQTSNVQHKTIQMTLLNPVYPGGVGPHPARDTGPA